MGAPVIVNVYDLSSQNSWSYWCGVGIFHAGVEVYGIEYAYGGHEYDYSGVFATKPRDAPGPVVFRESIPVGDTTLSQAEVQQLVQQMGLQYKGNTYHLLQCNCNHFASDLCQRLSGRPAPGWINRLAGLAIALHCLLPTTWVPPLTTPSVAQIESKGSNGRQVDDTQNLMIGPSASEKYIDPPVSRQPY